MSALSCALSGRLEGGLAEDLPIIAEHGDGEGRGRGRGLRGHTDDQGHGAVLEGLERHRRDGDLGVVQALEANLVGVRAHGVVVLHVEQEGVPDEAVVVHLEQRAGAPVDAHLEGLGEGQTGPYPGQQRQEERGIGHRAWADPAAALALLVGDGGVLDEGLVAELAHHVFAGVDAAGAVDALELVAVADVDALGADDHALAAVVAAVLLDRGLALLARLTHLHVVGDDEAVVVGQGALEAGVGADVVAGLLAEPGPVEEEDAGNGGDQGVLHAAGLARPQGPGGGEVADDGHAEEQGHDAEGDELGGLARRGGPGEAGLVAPHAGAAVTLDEVLDGPHPLFHEDRLGAEVAAPDAPEEGGEEEEAEGGHERHEHQQEAVDRGEGAAQEGEATAGEVHVDQRQAADGDPGGDDEQGLQRDARVAVDLLESTTDVLGVDPLSMVAEAEHCSLPVSLASSRRGCPLALQDACQCVWVGGGGGPPLDPSALRLGSRGPAPRGRP
mgnify:CR=1 FL=1